MIKAVFWLAAIIVVVGAMSVGAYTCYKSESVAAAGGVEPQVSQTMNASLTPVHGTSMPAGAGAPLQPKPESQPAEPPSALEAEFARNDEELAGVKAIHSGLEEVREQNASKCQDQLDKLADIARSMPLREGRVVKDAYTATQCDCRAVGRQLAGQIEQAGRVEGKDLVTSGLKEAYTAALEQQRQNSAIRETLETKSGPYLNNAEDHQDKLRDDTLKEIKKIVIHGRT